MRPPSAPAACAEKEYSKGARGRLIMNSFLAAGIAFAITVAASGFEAGAVSCDDCKKIEDPGQHAECTKSCEIPAPKPITGPGKMWVPFDNKSSLVRAPATR